MKYTKLYLFFVFVFSILVPDNSAIAQHSVARQWNEALLEAIRNDFARPTVHAHNLFHVSAAMYDAWAAYDPVAETYLLGKTVDGFNTPFSMAEKPQDLSAARREAISYAAYRLLKHRFYYSPGKVYSLSLFDSLMTALGYDSTFISTDYTTGSPAALGNYIAAQLIAFGLQDGSHEEYDYGNLYYYPVNTPLDPTEPGCPVLENPNRWQPLTLGTFIDQSGHQIPVQTPEFLGAEWGEVSPFALDEKDLSIYNRDGYSYHVFHDPGSPPYIDTTETDTIPGINTSSEEYKWTFSLVAVWASHLDPADSVMIDVSPAAIGNVTHLPETWQEFRDFYDLENGGDPGKGYELNPATAAPYQPQIVPRGDYARILAEFWADGPKSETPPGHWFTILNYVNDHPLFEKRFKGSGPLIDDLEWDVKAYFVLGGAMHDAAVAAWGVKGWYDYIRPVSAIRSMAQRGQCSDSTLAPYHPGGIPLLDGFVEIVKEGDALAGAENENVGKIKLYTWKGHYYIDDPQTEKAGVGWILADNWWPYQRPTFVTPPFAGYVSGHSTFSRAAAEVLTLLTGDEYFPGGMGEFYCPKNEFLVFEEGPSVDVILQWAKYRDASDQCSLSRIWGGIHPPADDIAGRRIGIQVGIDAFNLAEKYFMGQITSLHSEHNTVGNHQKASLYPNPVHYGNRIYVSLRNNPLTKITFYNVLGQKVYSDTINKSAAQYDFTFDTSLLSAGIYFVKTESRTNFTVNKLLILKQ